MTAQTLAPHKATVADQDTQKEWLERGQKVLFNNYAPATVVLDKGEGSYVQDASGKTYLDFASGIAVNSLGHCNDIYIKAITEQLQLLSHCSNLYLNKPAVELAETLLAESPFDKAFFCNSGTEAIECTIKLSRKYAKQHKGENCTKIVSMSNSFHGRTYGALSATAQTKYQKGFQPMVPDFETVGFNDIGSLKSLDLASIAAIIIEPIQGEGGIHPIKKEFLLEVKELCVEHNIVLIFDEIQCGVGRTGNFFAGESFGVYPDVVAMAKGLGGGFPIGAVLATEKVAQAFAPGDHGSTFGGNPLAAAAALACVKTIKNGNFLESVVVKSNQLLHALTALQNEGMIKAARGMGLMIGVELAGPAKPVIQKCAEKGLLLVGAGENVIRILPPLTVSASEITEAINILTEAIAEAQIS